MLRTIFAGLKGSFNFEQSLIERIACEDEIDREILRLLFEVGSQLDCFLKIWLKNLSGSRFPAIKLVVEFLRMNKRIEKEFGECIQQIKEGGIGRSQVSQLTYGANQMMKRKISIILKN